MIITLIPKDVARTGYQFTHLGGVQECEQCKLQSVCVNSLEKTKNYRVKKVRKKEHRCPIDDTKMVVCEVEEINKRIAVKDNKVMEGVILTREPIECEEILCEYYEKCVLEDFQESTRIKVVLKLKKIDCPIGLDLIEVEIEKVE
ncbi:MAG: UPF0179 family protein [Candidatus Heimdallarchaeaceae archaeon]